MAPDYRFILLRRCKCESCLVLLVIRITLDEVAAAAMQLGQGVLLLGMQWNGAVYVDGMLPFGLRSAPKIFMPSQIRRNGA